MAQKKIGSSTEFCGSPNFIAYGEEMIPFTETTCAVKEIRPKPRKSCARNAKGMMETGEQSFVVNGIKGRLKI